MRRRWVVGGGLAAVGALVGGGALVLRAQPMVEDAEVREAVAWFEARSARAAPEGCARAPLHGAATGGDGTEDFVELLDPEGAFAACMGLDAEALEAAFRGEVEGGRWRWDVPERPLDTSVGMAEGWDIGMIAVAPPPFPDESLPAVFREGLAACAGLDRAIGAVVAHERVCSPWRATGAPPTEAIRLVRLMKGLRILARGRVRAGDGAGAISMLLDGMRLAQDAGRGEVSMIAAMISAASMGVLASEVQTLLALELGLSDEEIAEIRRRLDALAASHPHPIGMLRGEAVYFVNRLARPALEEPGWTPPGGLDPDATPFGEEAARVAVVAYRALMADIEAACPEQGTPSECLRGLRALDASPRPADLPEALPLLLGPRVMRWTILGQLRDALLSSAPRFVTRHLGGWAILRGLRAIAGFHARRRDGGCPGVEGFAAEDLIVSELEDTMSVHELARGQQYEVHAPPILGSGAPGALPLLLTICPGLRPSEAGRP